MTEEEIRAALTARAEASSSSDDDNGNDERNANNDRSEDDDFQQDLRSPELSEEEDLEYTSEVERENPLVLEMQEARTLKADIARWIGGR